MKTKLAWKDKSKRWVSKGIVIGHFTMWAVRQSPWDVPYGLEKSIKEFDAGLEFGIDGLIETTYTELKKIVRDAIDTSDTILTWNVPKSRKAGMVFVTRLDGPAAEDDSTDLDALVRNIAQSVWLELFYDAGGFE